MFQKNLLPVMLLAVLLPTSGCGRQAVTPENRTSGVSGDVRIEFDFGDGRRIEKVLSGVEPGTTVETLMRRIGDVPVQITGSGTTALVQSIDHVANGAGKGWLYQVNGQWANRGIGQTQVNPGSEIRWRYGRFDTATAGAGAGS